MLVAAVSVVFFLQVDAGRVLVASMSLQLLQGNPMGVRAS
jgi:hypothetical protein